MGVSDGCTSFVFINTDSTTIAKSHNLRYAAPFQKLVSRRKPRVLEGR